MLTFDENVSELRDTFQKKKKLFRCAEHFSRICKTYPEACQIYQKKVGIQVGTVRFDPSSPPGSTGPKNTAQANPVGKQDIET